MPRKKEKAVNVKYYIPVDAKEFIDLIVDGSKFYKNKPVWKQKFYYIADYIAQQNISQEYSIEQDYVNIHEETMAKVVGVNNQQVATMLRDTVKHKLLKKDGLMRPAIKIKKGKQIHYLEHGKSYGYQFMKFDHLVEVSVVDCRTSDTHFRENRWEHAGKLMNGLEEYKQVLSHIRLDESRTDEIIQRILSNKQKKKRQKENYRDFINSLEIEFDNRHKIQCTIYPFAGVFVPVINSTALSTVCSYPDSSAGDIFRPDTPCWPSSNLTIYRVKKKRKKTSKDSIDEKDETTIARCKRAIYTIGNGLIAPNRPDASSRVYCEITNLYREFREALLLDDKRIVGLDIANSQPLIAVILIKQYWIDRQGSVPNDVDLYQKDCEAGQFYKNFMDILNVPPDLSGHFKKDFFQKVFFSMVIEENNLLKDMFVKRYPSCWEAICEIKGGVYSDTYSEFATRLQRVEAMLIFDTVNKELIRRKMKAFNIFDSLYVNNRRDFEIAKELTRQAFQEYGINPTFHLEYAEHLQDEENDVNYIATQASGTLEDEQVYADWLDEMAEKQRRHKQEQEELKIYYQNLSREQRLMWR